MKNFIGFGCLLYGAITILLINQQAMLVEAKPLLLQSNFFVLTTQAPCTSKRTKNCNSSPRPSSSSGGGVQTFNLLMPKLNLLTTLLQTKSSLIGGISGGSGGSSGGGILGGILGGIGGNKGGSSGGGIGGGILGGFALKPTTKPSTTTATTSGPDETTEPDSVFKPESTTVASSGKTTTTTEPESSTADAKPDNSNEDNKDGVSGSISVSAGTPAVSASTIIALSSGLGEESATNNESENTESNETADTASAPEVLSYTYINNSGDGDSENSSIQSSGYQYEKVENEV